MGWTDLRHGSLDVERLPSHSWPNRPFALGSLQCELSFHWRMQSMTVDC